MFWLDLHVTKGTIYQFFREDLISVLVSLAAERTLIFHMYQMTDIIWPEHSVLKGGSLSK